MAAATNSSHRTSVFPTAHKLAVGYSEAASLLSIGERTLRELVYTGEIPSLRVGTRRLIRMADLEAYVAAQVQQQRGT